MPFSLVLIFIGFKLSLADLNQETQTRILANFIRSSKNVNSHEVLNLIRKEILITDLTTQNYVHFTSGTVSCGKLYILGISEKLVLPDPHMYMLCCQGRRVEMGISF